MSNIFDRLKLAEGEDESKISYYQLLVFFIPLGASTLLITISNMLLNRCLGYIPNSEFYISSFAVARTLMLLIMSPVSIVALVMTTFTDNRQTFKKATKFSFISIFIIQIIFFIVAFTPISRYILNNLYNLEGDLLDNAVLSFKTICFQPSLFFTRNYFTAVAIKLRNIKFATLGSFIRAFLTFIFSLTMPFFLNNFEYEYIAGIIFLIIMIAETLVYAVGVLGSTKGNIPNHIVRSLKMQNLYRENADIDYKKIFLFALPLIMSYSMAQLLPSLTQSALALGENNEVILAIYSVSLSLIYIVGSFSYQIPQLVVNHDTFHPKNNNIIRKFCFMLASFMFFVMLLCAFTKIGDYLLLNLLKVSEENIEIAKLTLKFGMFFPPSLVFMHYKRGKLIKIRKTALLVFENAVGTLISLSLFIIVPLISWQYGAGTGILVYSIANFVTGFFTNFIFRASVKKNPDLLIQS